MPPASSARSSSAYGRTTQLAVSDAAPAAGGIDTAPAVEIVEAERLGETKLDAIAKAQSSAPAVVERMVKLEESLWSLAQLLRKLPEDLRRKLAADAPIERAGALPLESTVMNHNLALGDPD